MYYWINNENLNDNLQKYGEVLGVPDDMNEVNKYMSLYGFITFDTADEFNELNFHIGSDDIDDYISEYKFKELYLVVFLDNLNKDTISILSKIDYYEGDLTKEERETIKQDLLNNKFTFDDFCDGADFEKLEEYDLMLNSVGGDYDDLFYMSEEDQNEFEKMELVGEINNFLGGYNLYKTKNGDLYFNKYSNQQNDFLWKYDIYKKVKNYEDAGISKELWDELLEG